MRALYHQPLDPFCRKVRLVLAEKGLDVTLIEENPYERRQELGRLNPAYQTPVLIDEDPSGEQTVLAESQAIVEYVDESYEGPRVLPNTARARAETRRVCLWFDVKFEAEVNALLLREKVDARLRGAASADVDRIRAGLANLAYHMDYVDYLAETRDWLAGDRFTLADITVAAHLSCTDYLGEIRWRDFPRATEWYQRVKSRPSFRPLLRDRARGLPPARHYDDLDF